MDPDSFDAKFPKAFNFSLDPWKVPRRPEDYDDSWLDKEIEEEQDQRMKDVLIRVKKTMPNLITNTKEITSLTRESASCSGSSMPTTSILLRYGFEVGKYPTLGRKLCGSFITRYYCPPDTNITDYELDKLTSFAGQAIAQYNSTHETEFGNLMVIKAMRAFSCGFWHYLTFQANLPDHPPQIFEAKVYEEPHWVSPPLSIEFVRLRSTDDDYNK
ncbi:hypothetical protein AgCh_029836 [Apium graveolens]